MCGYSTLQAPDFDEQDHLPDVPVVKNSNYASRVGLERFKPQRKAYENSISRKVFYNGRAYTKEFSGLLGVKDDTWTWYFLL